MKIILSRKGFDSSCGGVASPILPGGEIVSLPIPERPGTVTSKTRTYGQIRACALLPTHRPHHFQLKRLHGPGVDDVHVAQRHVERERRAPRMPFHLQYTIQ